MRNAKRDAFHLFCYFPNPGKATFVLLEGLNSSTVIQASNHAAGNPLALTFVSRSKRKQRKKIGGKFTEKTKPYLHTAL